MAFKVHKSRNYTEFQSDRMTVANMKVVLKSDTVLDHQNSLTYEQPVTLFRKEDGKIRKK